MKRNTFRYLESITYEYYDIQKQIKELEQEILHATDTSHDEVQAGRVSTFNTKSETETRATALLDDKRLSRLKEQADAIKKAYEKLIAEKQELIKMYYWTDPNKESMSHYAEKLNISLRTAYRWRREYIHILGKMLGEI